MSQNDKELEARLFFIEQNIETIKSDLDEMAGDIHEFAKNRLDELRANKEVDESLKDVIKTTRKIVSELKADMLIMTHVVALFGTILERSDPNIMPNLVANFNYMKSTFPKEIIDVAPCIEIIESYWARKR